VTARSRSGLRGRDRLLELGLLAAILVLAAWLRLPDLDQRGQWDSDQGHDMAVLQSMVDGQSIPLLGPSTSIGVFHHGAAYYYLLAPAAALSGSDPVAVTVEIALGGIAAVAAIAWLARLVAGPLAGLLAGLLAAVSPSLIDSSTFIWNPNLLPLASALGFAGALQARRTGRSRWWLLAGLGVGIAMQLHVLAIMLVVPLAWAWADDLRRRMRAGQATRATVRGGIGALALIALGYLPLAIHELTNDFSEVRAILSYVLGGGGASAPSTGILERILTIAVRTLTWPIAGLVTDGAIASMLALGIVVALIVAAWLLADRGGTHADDAGGAVADGTAGNDATGIPGRWPTGWLIGTLVFSTLALAFLAPSLAVITPGLPNDHYHAFLDPVVLALAGVGIARIAIATWRTAGQGRRWIRAAGPAAAGGLTAGLVLVCVASWPPTVSPDGGWGLADAAAAHVIDLVASARQPGEPAVLVSLPAFKPDDAMRFPLTRRGLDLEPPITEPVAPGSVPTGVVTIVCDPLFDDTTGLPCGGPAEDEWLAVAYPPGTMALVERFRAGDRRILSVYAPSRLAMAGG
jgi:4-amino-4-deoxy-L-arabinose transferase-like glycosyltransferase